MTNEEKMAEALKISINENMGFESDSRITVLEDVDQFGRTYQIQVVMQFDEYEFTNVHSGITK